MPPSRFALQFAAALAAAAVLVAPRAGAADPAGLATPADHALYARLCAQVDAAWDSTHGGWVAKGVPNEDAIELALVRAGDGDALAGQRAAYTLAWLHALADTVGGGWVTSLKDADPRSTSFEKRTIPNARRLDVLVLAGGGRRGNAWSHEVAREADYIERVLLDPRGGFSAGQATAAGLEPESNGVMLQAWWRLASETGDTRQRDFARRSMARMWSDCRQADVGFVRLDALGRVREAALLPDQVEMARAHVVAWAATGRDTELALARALAAEIRTRFEEAKGGFRVEYATGRMSHSLHAANAFDVNARAARLFASLALACGDSAYASVARRTWASFDKPLAKADLDAAGWALAVRSLWADDLPEAGTWPEIPKPKAQPADRVIKIGRHH